MSEITNEKKVEKQVNIGNIENIEEVKELHIHQKDSQEKLADDLTSSNAWKELSNKDDVRNLKDKLLEVCSGISERKVKALNRNLINGKIEQKIYDERDISAVKYIVFDKCQHRLIDFYDTHKNKNELNSEEIMKFIQNYVSDAKNIIDDKRQVYRYPKFTDDFIEKIILDLIDECFLSFDEKGIYDD